MIINYNDLLNQASQFQKLAQQIDAGLDAWVSTAESFRDPFTSLMNQLINQPDAPQGKIDITLKLHLSGASNQIPKTTAKVISNDPAVNKWAVKNLSAFINDLTNKLQAESNKIGKLPTITDREIIFKFEA